MKDVLLKLAKGQTVFPCQWRGEANECEILMINVVTKKAFVRFRNPVMKTVRQEVDRETCWGLDRDDAVPMRDVEVETSEEWITL